MTRSLGGVQPDLSRSRFWQNLAGAYAGRRGGHWGQMTPPPITTYTLREWSGHSTMYNVYPAVYTVYTLCIQPHKEYVYCIQHTASNARRMYIVHVTSNAGWVCQLKRRYRTFLRAGCGRYSFQVWTFPSFVDKSDAPLDITWRCVWWKSTHQWHSINGIFVYFDM